MLEFLGLLFPFLKVGPVVPDVEGYLDIAFLIKNGDGVQGKILLHAVRPLDHDVRPRGFLRLVAGVEVLAADHRDIIVVEFLCKRLFPRSPPHPDILVVDVDPALVGPEDCDRKRIQLDHRVNTTLHPVDLFLFLPSLSEIVIDV